MTANAAASLMWPTMRARGRDLSLRENSEGPKHPCHARCPHRCRLLILVAVPAHFPHHGDQLQVLVGGRTLGVDDESAHPVLASPAGSDVARGRRVLGQTVWVVRGWNPALRCWVDERFGRAERLRDGVGEVPAGAAVGRLDGEHGRR